MRRGSGPITPHRLHIGSSQVLREKLLRQKPLQVQWNVNTGYLPGRYYKIGLLSLDRADGVGVVRYFGSSVALTNLGMMSLGDKRLRYRHRCDQQKSVRLDPVHDKELFLW